jgi:hypothetical protein
MRVNLNCPYADKDEAKRLGARWDKEKKTWYVVNATDWTVFAKWLKGDQLQKLTGLPKRSWPVTGRHQTFKYVCDCDVMPWENCLHTL